MVGPHVTGGPDGPTGADGASRLAAAVKQALSSDAVSTRRLSYAHTTVAFRVAGSNEPLTLLLDRVPAEIVSGHEAAEVEIRLTEGQVDQFTNGRLPLTAAVARGEVATRGPVRRYLEVDPILRRMLADLTGETNGASELHAARLPASEQESSIDSDLLAIQTTDLHKSFGTYRVLMGLNLEIPEGVVAVVLGPSGTGKSVLLQHIIGLLRPDSGDVVVRGRKLSQMSTADLFALRREIGVMFQDGALLGTMTVYDNTAFPLRQHTDLRENEIREVVMSRLSEVGLADAAARMPNELSGGMRKRAGLARSMILDPGILLCDEPDSGLDPVRTTLLADLLLEAHERAGGTTLVVTHDIRLARYVGDYMALIWKGNVIASGFAAEVLSSDDPFVKQFLAGEVFGPLGMD